MNAHVSKEELALMLPASLSHYFRDDVDYVSQPETQGPGLLARLAGGLRWLVSVPARRAVISELSALSDHELSDIGLSRGELGRVFDPRFSTSRSADRFAAGSASRYIAFN